MNTEHDVYHFGPSTLSARSEAERFAYNEISDSSSSSLSSLPSGEDIACQIANSADAVNKKEESYQYRDYCHVDDGNNVVVEGMGLDRTDEDEVFPTPTANASNETTCSSSSSSSIRAQKFPVKLYTILAQPEFNDVVSWMPHGRCWKVLRPGLFEGLVMPLFFEYANYHSFNRLVNAWSFRRVSTGPDRGAYYHEVSIITLGFALFRDRISHILVSLMFESFSCGVSRTC
jgi:hypothetical protein